MRRYTVVFTEAASNDLASIFNYVSEASSLDRAFAFCERIRSDCASLALAPNRGIAQQNGMRRIGVAQGRAFVMFRVDEDEVIVFAIGYFGRQR